MTPVVAPRRCGAPGELGRCTLTHGHTGQHWNAGGEWPTKAHGSEPMHGTADDVAALYRAMAGACRDIAAERRAEDQERSR